MITRHNHMKKYVLLLPLFLFGTTLLDAAEDKPHAVLVVGTLHYSPELTMPIFAKELERFGFRTTVVMGEGNPEKKTENVLPGIEILKDADLVIFFMRFLKLPELCKVSSADSQTDHLRFLHLNLDGLSTLARLQGPDQLQ